MHTVHHFAGVGPIEVRTVQRKIKQTKQTNYYHHKTETMAARPLTNSEALFIIIRSSSIIMILVVFVLL